MVIGRAIFPGTSTLNQIEKILELLGRPTKDDIESIESTLAENIITNISITKKKGFESFFPNCNPDTLDLLKKLLIFNPANRLTADQVLKHKYLKEFHNTEQEINCDHIIAIPMNDNKKFSIKEYREALYNDISQKKKEERKKSQAKYLAQLGIVQNQNDNKKGFNTMQLKSNNGKNNGLPSHEPQFDSSTFVPQVQVEKKS